MERKNNIFVIGLDMDNCTPEDIAKDAVLQIISITDKLIEEQKEEKHGRL